MSVLKATMISSVHLKTDSGHGQDIRLTCSWCLQGSGSLGGQLAVKAVQALLQEPHLPGHMKSLLPSS